MIVPGLDALTFFTRLGVIMNHGVPDKRVLNDFGKAWNVEFLGPPLSVSLYTFVVTVYNGSGPRRQLRGMGCQCVMHFAALYWKYADQFIPSSCLGLPHSMWDDADNIRLGYSLLADEHSRALFREQLRWRLNLDSDSMVPSSPVAETYFPPDIITSIPDEVLVDCGAFDGDSIKDFLSLRNNQVARIFALEPDKENRVNLQQYRASLPHDLAARISILPFAVAKQSGYVNFESGNLVRSRVIAMAQGAATECRTLDEICDGAGCTYIKMDIEGLEPDAIEGAAGVLNRDLPVLAACVYHRWEHL
jgi:FkbM family methyltransferase